MLKLNHRVQSQNRNDQLEAVRDNNMILAVSLIKTVPGHEKIVFRALKDIAGVRNLYHIFGNHDVFMILESEGLDSLRQTLKDIDKMTSVNSVKTLLVEPGGKLSLESFHGNEALLPSPG